MLVVFMACWQSYSFNARDSYFLIPLAKTPCIVKFLFFPGCLILQLFPGFSNPVASPTLHSTSDHHSSLIQILKLIIQTIKYLIKE